MPSQHCILFYKYHPLTSDPSTLDRYRLAQEKLCQALNLTGRILIGLSEEGEGINGTLAGEKCDLSVYVDCMMGRNFTEANETKKNASDAFRAESKFFFDCINRPELIFSSETDFKWSTRSTLSNVTTEDTSVNKEEDQAWFPDLNIKLVKEIISTGGAFSNITANETSVGYLTPREWHEEMKLLQQRQEIIKNNVDDSTVNEVVETVLIDVRNHKECQIGTFLPGVAIDPNTRTFSQFPKWVRDHSHPSVGGDEVQNGGDDIGGSISLDNKRILLYCTGGIRCEKASAFVRQMVPTNKGVYHLKGGIHKYLEEFGKDQNDCAFIGKNFVFDRRGAMSGADCLDGDQSGSKGMIVGQCLYCNKPHDSFLPENICTVCREPVLVCTSCVKDLREQQQQLRGTNDNEHQNSRVEFHCEDHFQIKTCYFTSLHGYSMQELNNQIQQLQLYSEQFEGIGKKGKQKRRTIRKQIEKIESFIKTLDSGGILELESCRNCGSSTCAGDCWGFHGGNTRMMNKEKAESVAASEISPIHPNGLKKKERTRTPSNHRPAKRMKRQKELDEIERLGVCRPPSEYRLSNGLRVPPPSVRVLRSSVKGRWCGKTLGSVMSTEFQEFTKKDDTDGDWLNKVINAGLLRINGIPVSKVASEGMDSSQDAAHILLRNMDTLERIVHWHEPPICVPERISFTKHTLPESLISMANDTSTSGYSNAQSQPVIYCINKPSTVPVHPAGPYYANSLLLMVEAQEGLAPRSLIPCHRIDRCTSGVLLCTSNNNVARVVQGAMTSTDSSTIKKMYLARVRGRFPSSPSDNIDSSRLNEHGDIASYTWHGNTLEVSAPIAVHLSGSEGSMCEEDKFAMMHRVVSSDGKHAVSRFKLISYDSNTNQSLVSCAPISGRGHQLRVHLQLIGHPIHDDVEYGGKLNPEAAKEQEAQSIKSILEVSKSSPCLHDESVYEKEAETAISLCKCCCDGECGVKASFQSAQLLGCGHAIDLHAYKYLISFKHKVAVEFTTTMPNWASDFKGTSLNEIHWLQ